MRSQRDFINLLNMNDKKQKNEKRKLKLLYKI